MSRGDFILVTGAAGFIGSTLVDRLLSEGRRVVGLDSFDSFYSEKEKLRNLTSALDHGGFELVRGDIRDSELIDRTFSRGFDAVVHLAALAGVRPSFERPADYADVNVRGTSVLLDAAVRHGKPGFVFASSSSVYGERSDGPFRESDPVDHPISPYAATKKAGIPFLNGMNAQNVEQMIDEGVRIGANPGAVVADRGRRYTNRKMPW